MTLTQAQRDRANILRRVTRARDFPTNTCPASRHAHMIGEHLIKRQLYAMLHEEPEHCGATILSVVGSLFRARTMLIKHGIDPSTGNPLVDINKGETESHG